MAYAARATTHHQTYPRGRPGGDLHPTKVNNLDPMVPRPRQIRNYPRAPSSRRSGLVGAPFFFLRGVKHLIRLDFGAVRSQRKQRPPADTIDEQRTPYYGKRWVTSTLLLGAIPTREVENLPFGPTARWTSLNFVGSFDRPPGCRTWLGAPVPNMTVAC